MPAAYEGTDIISCLRSKYIIRCKPYIISRKRYIIFYESPNSYSILPNISFLYDSFFMIQYSSFIMTLSQILYVKISMDPVNQVNIIQYRQLYCFLSFAKFTNSFLNRCFLFGKELFNAENNNHFSRHYRQKQRQCHL